VVGLAAGCGGDGEAGPPNAGDRQRSGGAGGGPRPAGTAAVPVEVATVDRRDISSYIETNGTLEAENEVDIVARISGPIVELKVEEGMAVEAGQLLARLEQDEIRAQLEISRVELNESRLAFERARTLQGDDLISAEAFEQAEAAFESARAQFEGNQILFGYTEIRAPFGGLIVNRYIDFAEQVSTNTPLFRISDFTPLLCPIQVPERDLPRLRSGQRAYLTVEAYPDAPFPAQVLRISPVVEAGTGTIKVTLDVDAQGQLRPGMFARVFLETDVHSDTLVMPKAALSLESIGDTVYVIDGEAVDRREVSLGFQEGDHVEALSGVEAGELVVVVGQDGLSAGTPVRVLRRDGVATERGAPPGTGEEKVTAAPPGPSRPDFSTMTAEQLEQVKERMRSRGMTEEQIEDRIRRAREAGQPPAGGDINGGSADSASSPH
jgi:membrane fusion protein (multidrug efflux system)